MASTFLPVDFQIKFGCMYDFFAELRQNTLFFVIRQQPSPHINEIFRLMNHKYHGFSQTADFQTQMPFPIKTDGADLIAPSMNNREGSDPFF